MGTRVILLAASALIGLAAPLGCASSTSNPDGSADTSTADSGRSDAADSGPADSGRTDTGAPDTSVPADTSVPDTSVPTDTSMPDTGPADSGMPPMDTSVPPVCGDGICTAGEVISCEADCDLTPTMTSSTTPSGLVTSSGDFGASYPAWHVFDGASATMTAEIWLSQLDLDPAWVAYEFAGAPRTVMRYGIRYANGSLTSRAPRDWQLQGWNGAAWVTLDTQSGQTGWTSGEWRRFTLATPGPYPRYRLYITADNDSRMPIVTASVGELGLWGM